MADLEDFIADGGVGKPTPPLPLTASDPAVQQAIEKAQQRLSGEIKLFGKPILTIPRIHGERQSVHETWVVDEEGNTIRALVTDDGEYIIPKHNP